MSACSDEGVTAVAFRAGAYSGAYSGVGDAKGVDGIHGGVTVTVLDGSDGRADIARAARSVAAARRRGDMSEEELDAMSPDAFGEWLSVRVPQLDLVFKFGACDGLCAMLPWHISVAEIIKFDSVRDVSERAFMDGIGTFVGSDRRFGR
jgi:undecaprenyl pyrophosphate synthase